MKHKIFSIIGVIVMVFALTVMPGWQGQATASTKSVTTSITISAAQQEAAMAYWTRTAMADAKPLPMPQLKNPQASKKAPAITGVPNMRASGAAAPNANSLAQKAYPSDWVAGPEAAASPDILPAGSSGVNDQYNINVWQPAQTIVPHSWVGRLYMTGTPGSGYCSATAQYGNNFVTAAHCVYDLGTHQWFSNWYFTPAYRNGGAPYGSFASTTCTILTAWMNQPNYSFAAIPYDVAVCTVGTNSSGYTLNQMVGWAGRVWNYSYWYALFTMGYPWQDTNGNSLGNAGQYLRTCVSETGFYANDVLRTGCTLGPGISGGPWIYGYFQNSTGYVMSVVSGYVQGVPNLYGIRFTDYNIQPICSARGC